MNLESKGPILILSILDLKSFEKWGFGKKGLNQNDKSRLMIPVAISAQDVRIAHESAFVSLPAGLGPS